MNRLTQFGAAVLTYGALHAEPVYAQEGNSGEAKKTQFCDVPKATLEKSNFLLFLGLIQSSNEADVAQHRGAGRILIPEGTSHFKVYQPIDPAFVTAKDKIPSIQFTYKDQDEAQVPEFYAGAYDSTLIMGPNTYLVVTEKYNLPLEVCPDLNDARGAVSESVRTVADTSSPVLTTEPASQPWHVIVGGGLGYNEEELGSEYSLGGAGYGSLSVQVRPPSVPVCVGVNGDVIVAEEGAGFEGLTGTVGYCKDRLDVSLQVGVSGEPRAPETTLNGAPTVGVLAHYDVYQNGSWGVQVGASLRADLYGGGVFPANSTAFVGVSRDFEIGGTKKKQKGPTPQVAVQVPAESIDASNITYKKVPYTLESRETDTLSELDEGTRVRILGDMKKAANGSAWLEVEVHFQSVLKLKGALTYEDYVMGAQAAHELGNIKAEYERFLWAYDVKKTKEVGDRLKTIELNYAYVDILIKGGVVADLVPTPFPFGPTARDSLALVRADFEGDRHATGFLPIMDDSGNEPLTYTLGGVPLKLEPISRGQVAESKPGQKLAVEKPYYPSKSSDRSVTRIVLEK